MSKYYTFKPEFVVVVHDDGTKSYEWDWAGSFDCSYDNATDESELDDEDDVCRHVDTLVADRSLPRGEWSPHPSPEQIQAALDHLASLTDT